MSDTENRNSALREFFANLNLSKIFNNRSGNQMKANQDALEKEHKWYADSVHIMIMLGLWGILPVNFYTMFIGIQAETQRWTVLADVNTLQAIMITGTISFLMWIKWYGIYSFVSRCRSSWGSYAIAMFSLLVLLLAFTTSSVATYIGISNPITRPSFMHDKLVEASEKVNLIMDSSRNARAALPRLKALETQSCDDAVNEAETGGLTRTGSGFGIGAATYKSVCSGIGSVRKSLEININETQIRSDKINQNLEELFIFIDNRKIPILEREDRFFKGMAQLSRLQRDYRSQGLGKVVVNSAGILRNLIPPLEDASNLNARLVATVKGLRSKLNAEAKDLKRVIGSDKGSILEPIFYRSTLLPISFQYIGELFHFFIMSIVLDIFPFLMLWFRAIYSTYPKKGADEYVSFHDRLILSENIPAGLFEERSDENV